MLTAALDIREIVCSRLITIHRLLSWSQAGYTLEQIDVYGVGPEGEEVVVVHKVRVFSPRFRPA